MSQQMTKDKVLDLLRSKSCDEQREGAFAARDLNCQEAVPLLITLLQSDNVGVQEAAELALRKIGGRRAVNGLIPLLRSDSASIRNLAMDILRHIGHEDLESLINLLKDPDPDVRIFAADILGTSNSHLVVLPLCEALLRDPEINVRYQAAVSLGNLKIKEAAPCLHQALEEDDEWVQFAVIEALLKIRDDSSIKALIGALDKSSELVGSMIVDALGEMGNIKSVPLLLKKLDSSSTALRNKIIKALVNILGGKSLTFLSEAEREKFNEYLLVALDDDEEEIQDAAISGLSFVGDKRATKKILALAAKLDPDKDHERLMKIIAALEGIGINEELVSGLKSDHDPQVIICIKVLGRIGGKEAARLLMDIFWEKHRDIQRELSLVLMNIAGHEARDFFVHVLEKHTDGDVIKCALKFLGQKLRDEQVVDKLFEFLDHPWDDVKEAALDAILGIGGEKVLAKFKQMFSSPDPMYRLMAVYGFGKLGARECLEELKQALEDEVPDVRKIALEAIASVCEERNGVLEIISDKLYDENREVRLTLVELMGKCSHKESIPYLLEALEDEDDWVKVRALEALGLRKVKEALPPIINLLQSPSELVRIKAIEALGEIGGRAAFRALIDVLDSDNEEVLNAAEMALDKIQEAMEKE
ncbi:HEAT repeat domain-containing protein [Desulfohalobiaceae bacterium Ax17]|uniref:HEAT repeat domain-containing protein n=1 Tax=Desulfovulcanus ferrireducens TaxID=2831190 RepID=UPI00207BAFBE|nr:HEAT repeat domain-containing protein [Desulfovulcanus ferrireducens]MBT8762667.1 HEAT repeat domain-containing protein [Desulfovulcanus ferrireducens]